jgi:hypothetical protein
MNVLASGPLCVNSGLLLRLYSFMGKPASYELGQLCLNHSARCPASEGSKARQTPANFS